MEEVSIINRLKMVEGEDVLGESMKFKAILEPQPGGGYVAYVPALPGCFTQGETEDEALENIKEAIELYLEVLEERKPI